MQQALINKQIFLDVQGSEIVDGNVQNAALGDPINLAINSGNFSNRKRV